MILMPEEAPMEKQVVTSAEAPRALGPYSQAVRCGDFLFLSGQVGIDPRSGKLVEGGVEAQARQIFSNMAAVLAAAGIDCASLIKTTVFLKDMAHFKTVNEVYALHVPQPFPARSALAVRDLPVGAEVEIEAIAMIGK